MKQDYAEAVRWFRKAAEQGHAGAQSNLGVMYKNGQGVKRDHAEAVRWFRKAAEQGQAKAHYNLGVMYANGQGVRQDHPRPCAGTGRPPSKDMPALSPTSVLCIKTVKG